MDGKKPLFSADAAEEYFSTLLTYYRNTGNDIFKRDNEGRHVSDQIYSAEYQKYLGMQIAMREVLEYFAKFELGDTALRQQEHFRDLTKNVEPLTLDELRKMDGEPVWIVEEPDWGHWELSADAEDYVTDREPSFYGMKHNDQDGRYGLHKLGWLAYRQKPEEDDHDERKENENV